MREVFLVPIFIRKGPRDSNETLIKKFQKRIITENVIQEYRDREFHKTESEKRQERRAEKMRKIMRANRGYNN